MATTQQHSPPASALCGDAELDSHQRSKRQKTTDQKESRPQSSSGIADEILELVRCPISLEFMRVPVLLPCTHVFEFACIEAWMKSKPNASCPVCRSPIRAKACDMPVSLHHVRLREIALPDEKIEWGKLRIPAGPLSNASALIGQYPGASAAATLAPPPQDVPGTQSGSHGVLTALVEAKRLRVRKLESLTAWALRFVEKDVAPVITRAIEAAGVNFFNRQIQSVEVPASILVLTSMHAESLQRVLRLKFGSLLGSRSVEMAIGRFRVFLSTYLASDVMEELLELSSSSSSNLAQ